MLRSGERSAEIDLEDGCTVKRDIAVSCKNAGRFLGLGKKTARVDPAAVGRVDGDRSDRPRAPYRAARGREDVGRV